MNIEHLIAKVGNYTSTPKAITEHIARLCSRVAPGQCPVFVAVNVQSHSKVNDCFGNVRAHVEGHGGMLQHGWALWEWPNVIVEAEFHAVWLSPNGAMQDITPRKCAVQEILFLPDPTITFEGRQIDNVRLPLRDDELVRDLIAIGKKRFLLMNKGGRADRFGAVELSLEEMAPLAAAGVLVEAMLSQGLTANDLCACESGRKYKNCCGPRIRQIRP